ncbi:DgyrCDS9075 [Dimorphilus gyrociliatus]|uniref:DgyrCDS9075 n=1 Tax=Dimorphilus gyrociliatus TaxID=2664684 RepID=A0A7I8VX98_9ANNE|nr:DgyrCDS9075 [Dimorphilus gyrociliatus]
MKGGLLLNILLISVINIKSIKCLTALTCNNDNKLKFDCHPDKAESDLALEENCKSRGCCYVPSKGDIDTPSCFFPANFNSYKMQTKSCAASGCRFLIKRAMPSGWPRDINEIRVDLTFGEDIIRIKFTDPKDKRFEVPLVNHFKQKPFSNSQFQFDFVPDPFGIRITRRSTGAVIFDTTGLITPIIFSDQFIQISTKLNTGLVQGIGEHQTKVLLNATSSRKRYSLWTRDQGPTFNANLYGAHPVYLQMESDSLASGVFLLNSNAMDIDLTPAPAATFRTIGGVLDFFIYAGPTPDRVISQHTQVVAKPFFPPYWSLGFHLCRYGYNSAKNLKNVIDRNRAIGLPYEVQWNDIDYMNGTKDFTYDHQKYYGLPEIVKDLHEHDQKYVIILDPAISSNQKPGTYKPYDEGLRRKVFMTNESGGVLIGKVWPGETAFPDFFHNDTIDWWTDQLFDYHRKIPYDSLWNDMNEPSNFVEGSISGCPKNSLNNPPYTPPITDGRLSAKTVCPSSLHHKYHHYNVHNMYGLSESRASHIGLTRLLKKRTFVISRSTFAGSGKYSGHWGGDQAATWQELYYSITQMLNFQLYGIPFMGGDICGFVGDTTEELCIRWTQVGAFYPFMRNHNNLGGKDQDPAVFSKRAQEAIIDVTKFRYFVMPYLYSLLYLASTTGKPVVRPLFYNFPADKIAWPIDQQFMWGECLLISPVLTPNTTVVRAYFPTQRYYDVKTKLILDSTGQWLELAAPLNTVNVHLLGGCILPTLLPETTTTKARQNPFGALIGLDRNENAKGFMYWDNGDDLEYGERNTQIIFKWTTNADKKTALFEAQTLIGNYKEMKTLDDIILNDTRVIFGKVEFIKGWANSN